MADGNKVERAGVDKTDSSSGGSGDCCGFSCLVLMMIMIDEGMTMVITNTSSSSEKGKQS